MATENQAILIGSIMADTYVNLFCEYLPPTIKQLLSNRNCFILFCNHVIEQRFYTPDPTTPPRTGQLGKHLDRYT